MGLVLGFRRVMPEELAKVVKDPQLAGELLDSETPAGEPDGYLDKSWGGLQFLFDATEVPVDLRMDGDLLVEEPFTCGWDADLVAQTARRLRETPFDELARHYDPYLMQAQEVYPAIWYRDDALDYLRAHYAGLVEFFEAAAASGAGALLYFG